MQNALTNEGNQKTKCHFYYYDAITYYHLHVNAHGKYPFYMCDTRTQTQTESEVRNNF